jgi:hypothetical protein
MQHGKDSSHRLLVRGDSARTKGKREKADVFSVQELILSSIYVYQAWRLLKNSFNPKSRSILYQLLVVNGVVILLDLSLLVLQNVNLHQLQVCLKPAIYSIKLKLEFTVLGQLIGLVPRGGEQ